MPIYKIFYIKGIRFWLDEAMDYIEGNGYFRLNIGCTRKVLKDGVERIEKALKSFR